MACACRRGGGGGTHTQRGRIWGPGLRPSGNELKLHLPGPGLDLQHWIWLILAVICSPEPIVFHSILKKSFWTSPWVWVCGGVVCRHTCLCVPVHVGVDTQEWRPEVGIGSPPPSFPTLLFWDRVSHWAWSSPTQPGFWPAWSPPPAPKDPLASAFPCWSYRHTWLFPHG